MRSWILCGFLLVVSSCIINASATNLPLPIGAAAPDFHLRGTDLRDYSLDSFARAEVLVIIFTSNHCAAAQGYEDRIRQLVKDYAAKQVQVVAIMPNDPASVRLDELGYSDLGDSFNEMRIRARDKAFNFPYLYDGDSAGTARAYGATRTPEVFIFDQKRLLQYTGRFDEMEDPLTPSLQSYARRAIEALLLHQQVPLTVTEPLGCAIALKSDRQDAQQAQVNYAKERVVVDRMNDSDLTRLLRNDSKKLRLINIWTTWCLPCLNELPDLVAINRMYRARSFEIVTICVDKADKRPAAQAILSRFQLATNNYLYTGDKLQLVRQVDPGWPGGFPYTLIIEPGGKIIFAKQGGIQPMRIKKIIIDHPLMGRYH